MFTGGKTVGEGGSHDMDSLGGLFEENGLPSDQIGGETFMGGESFLSSGGALESGSGNCPGGSKLSSVNGFCCVPMPMSLPRLAEINTGISYDKRRRAWCWEGR